MLDQLPNPSEKNWNHNYLKHHHQQQQQRQWLFTTLYHQVIGSRKNKQFLSHSIYSHPEPVITKFVLRSYNRCNKRVYLSLGDCDVHRISEVIKCSIEHSEVYDTTSNMDRGSCKMQSSRIESWLCYSYCGPKLHCIAQEIAWKWDSIVAEFGGIEWCRINVSHSYWKVLARDVHTLIPCDVKWCNDALQTCIEPVSKQWESFPLSRNHFSNKAFYYRPDEFDVSWLICSSDILTPSKLSTTLIYLSAT